jgi:hypothetical protein
MNNIPTIGVMLYGTTGVVCFTYLMKKFTLRSKDMMSKLNDIDENLDKLSFGDDKLKPSIEEWDKTLARARARSRIMEEEID